MVPQRSKNTGKVRVGQRSIKVGGPFSDPEIPWRTSARTFLVCGPSDKHARTILSVAGPAVRPRRGWDQDPPRAIMLGPADAALVGAVQNDTELFFVAMMFP